jgi:hypothetical protein
MTRVVENRPKRGVTGDWSKLQFEELHGVYPLPSII